MTLKELKKRHESGQKQFVSVRAQIRSQIRRVCAHRDCSESLAFTNSRKVLCATHKGIPLAVAVTQNNKKRKTSYRSYTKLKQQRVNRDKKKRYYERHGIKFDKNVRNRDYKPDDKSPGVEYTSQTLLYENYKEPLKKIENGKGYGYYGTLALTDDKEYVQCHICGNLFSFLAMHLSKHKISARKYKETYQLSITTALISEPARKTLMENTVKANPIAIAGQLPIWLQEYNKKVQTGQVKHPGNKAYHKGLSLEKRNQLGLCPEQVLEKIRALAEKLGHTPSYEEFRTEHGGRYLGSIKFQHGSYLKAVAKLGLKSAKELKEPTKEELLQDLVDFYDTYGRIPMTSDFKRGLLRSRTTYFYHFGTLNNARVEAGLNAILPMPFGKIVELTPDQYLLYQSGKPLPDLFKQTHQRSSSRRKRPAILT